MELERKYKGATALFFQGAGADMNPMPRHSVALAQQFGQELAAAVVRVLNEEMKALDPQLGTAYSEIDLELNPAFSKEELERLKSMGKTEKGYIAYKSKWAERMLTELDQHGKLPASYPYPVTGLANRRSVTDCPGRGSAGQLFDSVKTDPGQ